MKNFFINTKMILSLFVLSLFLGTLSTTYAGSVPVPQSLNDFNSYIESIMQYMGTTNDNYKALVKLFNSSSWDVSCNTLPWGQYDNLIIRESRETSVHWYIDFIFYNGNYNFSVNGNYVQPNGSLSAGCYRYDIINLGTTYGVKALEELTQTYSGPTFTHRIADNYHFAMFFTPYEILNPNNVTIWAYNFPILDYFTWEYNPTLIDINIEDFPAMKQTRGTTDEIADFGLTINLDTEENKPRWGYYYYNEFRGYWEPSANISLFNRYTIENESIGHIFLDKKMLIPNTVVYIQLFPKDREKYDDITIFMFIRDNNSVVNVDTTTGKPTLNVNDTFSGDYLDYYNNMISNMENEWIGAITNASGDKTGGIDFSPIINNQNDTSEVDSIMSSYLSGDSQDFASRMGYSVLENPFTSFLFDILDGIFDALTDTTDITIGANYKTINLSLNSADFITPESPFKNFIRNMLICVYIYGNYKFFYHLIISLEIGDLRKFVALIGTDQFTDITIM